MKIQVQSRALTVQPKFHKCKICGRLFHHGNKTSYCTKCVPDGGGWGVALLYKEVVAERSKNEQG